MIDQGQKRPNRFGKSYLLYCVSYQSNHPGKPFRYEPNGRRGKSLEGLSHSPGCANSCYLNMLRATQPGNKLIVTVTTNRSIMTLSG